MADNPRASRGAATVRQHSNKRTASTTYNWEWRKIRRRPQGQQGQSAAGRRWFALPPWDRRRPLTVQVVWRGGPEAWIEVRARGSMGRFPGYVAIADAVAEVMRADAQP